MKRSIEVCFSKALRAEKGLLLGSFGLACIAAVMLALVTFPLKADESNNPEEVGRVTLVIGQAFAHNKNGDQRPLKRGDAVYVNESIETSAGGHVHLRFVDEGTVSLRPNSRLNIELYHYDKLQPKNSAIRFNLEAGVVRSISGKATQAAHDRFRLNTPITAIGVLGTDFVVRAEPEKMWAGVYSGAIAISPLNAQCAASGLGPCAGATRLSEAMGSVMIEFGGGKEREKIVPLDSAIISKSNSDKGMDKPTDSMPVASGRMNAAEIKAADVATQLDGVPQGSRQDPQPTPPDTVVAQPNPFAWARWSSQLPGDTMSQAYQTAQSGRTATVGNRYYALFRAPTALTELEPHAGVYDFKLQQGQAQFISNRSQNVEAARLDAASLQVDFGQRQFNTHLEMSHPSAGSAVLNESGQIGNNGIFAGGNVVSGSGVAGALSTDGAYASMLFRKEVESGTFVGITDWAKK